MNSAATPLTIPTSDPSVSQARPPSTASLHALQPLNPDLHERAWASVPHPTLPLLATAHAKSVTIFSLSTLSSHSGLSGGHARSVRSVAWKPGLPPHKLCLVSGSFDATAGLWRWDDENATVTEPSADGALEREIKFNRRDGGSSDDDDDEIQDREWEFTLVLEGHDSEVKSCAFNPSGAYLATCSRDKSVWIWEDVGAAEADDEWETIAVLNEHEADVKAVAWCPDVPGRSSPARRAGGVYSADVLASASYDDTVRIWREDSDGDWVCVAVLEGHQGTVWGLQWEGRPRADGLFPRLLSFSADGTIRVWTLKQEDNKSEETGGNAVAEPGPPGGFGGRLGGIPNTMRQSLREEWSCTAILPRAHERNIYSVAWSVKSGLVASTGSDGIIALYQESDMMASTRHDLLTSNSSEVTNPEHDTTASDNLPASSRWKLLATKPHAHGPYEVNHITWCKRYGAGAESKGDEEILITTGDDGLVQPWEVRVSDSSK